MELISIKEIKNSLINKTDLSEAKVQSIVDDLPRVTNIITVPCYVGDTVYKICPISPFLNIGDKWDGRIITTDCHRCSYYGCGCINIGYKKDAKNIIREIKVPNELWLVERKHYFGEIYFLTREEAEKYINQIK